MKINYNNISPLKDRSSILVTGAAGHIGSNLCKWLVNNQPHFKVVALDDLSGGYLEWIPTECEIVIRNVGSDLTDLFEKHDIRIVYHCAAEAAESVSSFKRKFYYESNVVNSANVINFCIKYNVDRLVYFSSMAVYGNNQVPFTEDQTPAPIDPYGIGKYAVELDLHCAEKQHGLRWTIVRPHSVYGPQQNIWDSYRNVIGIFIRKLHSNEPLSIYGDGSQKRAFTYIDDIMKPLWRCAINESTLWKTFNIGNDEEISILELAELVLDEVGVSKDKLEYFSEVHEVKNAFSDHSRVKNILGLECKTSLREGFRKMWNWSKSQPKRELQIFDSFELEVGLYDQFKTKV